MRASKSESKPQFSLKKYENFLQDKNWKDPMYMDSDPNTEKADLSARIKSQYSLPKGGKLSLSLHEKVGTVLSDNRKMGMLSTTTIPSIKKSTAKISYASTLPPIKTETL